MLVKNIDFDKNCESCMAAKRIIDNSQHILLKAVSKIKQQSTEIAELKNS